MEEPAVLGTGKWYKNAIESMLPNELKQLSAEHNNLQEEHV